MTKTFRFYKNEENNNWYIDLPEYIEAGGSVEELQMVLGADEWLDKLTAYGTQISLKISDEEVLRNQLILSETCTEDTGGAYYYAFDEEDNLHHMWLCDVTLYIFESFPKVIYYE